MQLLPLQAIPNQAFSIVLDNNQWLFVIKTTNGVMSVSLGLNNDVVLDNARAVANGLIIPSRYQESGNFIFITQGFQLPYYTEFGTTQALIYVTAAELETFRAPVGLPITASDFSPLGALPLRFAPQGYTV